MKNMVLIQDEEFGGERPLFASSNVELNNVRFSPGESALKECENIKINSCVFDCKYPFWHNQNTIIKNSLFTPMGRAAIWYGKDIRMAQTHVDAPKMFREIDGLFLDNVELSDALECIWWCRNIEVKNTKIKNGDYIFKSSENITVDNLLLQGNYSFQYCSNVVIRNSHISSKDAFWNAENVTVYDSVIEGEYLGWHSKNLRLVNCKINGTQPLCYAHNLVMENCVMLEDANLAFEYSTLKAVINSPITSVKNPGKGEITAESIGEIIIDANCKNPGECNIRVSNAVNV
ncbi:DUF3737 family protein [Carboxylicivirga caseinilyticus]|uniref:DUF3737 family protein n=1 Tax=Carboxylicivirga caseinilyticus TaxID=3417572 RepID=UPI003D33BB71|nr:DUF3737 family protein [Marinilabiliaceae bacterium A049]